jgi:hypothetical protein
VLSKKVGCTARYTVSISEGVATVRYLEPQHTAACLALKQRSLPADTRANVSALFETGLRVPVHDALKLNWDVAERQLAAEWDCSEEEVNATRRSWWLSTSTAMCCPLLLAPRLTTGRRRLRPRPMPCCPSCRRGARGLRRLAWRAQAQRLCSVLTRTCR